MALAFCTRCGHRVSTTAPKCPQCGTPPYEIRNKLEPSANKLTEGSPPGTVSASVSDTPSIVSAQAKKLVFQNSAKQTPSPVNTWPLATTRLLLAIGLLVMLFLGRQYLTTELSHFWLGVEASEHPAPPPSPRFKVQVLPDENLDPMVSIASLDSQSVWITRFVFNGRRFDELGTDNGCEENCLEKVCDFNGERKLDPTYPVPRRLNMGDSVSFPWSHMNCGKTFVRVDIYTDRGNVSYLMK